MSRREYKNRDCLTHLLIRYEEKITKLVDDLFNQQNQNTRLKDEVKKQKEQITKLKDEVDRQHEQIKKLNGEVRTTEEWLNNHNMNVSTDKENILTINDNSQDAWIQSSYSLEERSYSFAVKILKVGGLIYIGISHKNLPNIQHSVSYHSNGHLYFGQLEKVESAWEHSISYQSNGQLYFGQFEKVGSAWKDGDLIECGIKFPKNFKNDRRQDIAVYFLRNGQFIAERPVIHGFYPTIWLNGSETRTKVKYSRN